MHVINFTGSYSVESFDRLAHAFHSLVSKETFTLPAEMGEGFVRRVEISEELVLRYWHLKPSKPMEINRLGDRHPGAFFHFCFFLRPGLIHFHQTGMTVPSPVPSRPFYYILADQAEMSIELQPNEEYECLGLTISAEGLPPAIREKLTGQVDPEQSGFRRVAYQEQEGRSILDLCAAIRQGQPLLKIKAGVFGLLHGVLSNFGLAGNTQYTQFLQHQDKIMQVEQYILGHLESGMPPLRELSVELNMSESTMERHFKQLFGKSIYSYYLEKKMGYARQLLLTHTLNVSEVAARLGYGKVSHFSRIFKKYNGCLPGKMKR